MSGFRVLLGMAFGCLWGIGASQWLSAAYYGKPVLLWVVFTSVGPVGVAVVAYRARHGGWRRRPR